MKHNPTPKQITNTNIFSLLTFLFHFHNHPQQHLHVGFIHVCLPKSINIISSRALIEVCFHYAIPFIFIFSCNFINPFKIFTPHGTIMQTFWIVKKLPFPLNINREKQILVAYLVQRATKEPPS